jgi:hypothetical protein
VLSPPMNTFRMRTRRLGRPLAVALLAVFALPGAAHAATLVPLKPCYVSVTSQQGGETRITREDMSITGSGFTPNAPVDLSIDGRLDRTVPADAAGNLAIPAIDSPYRRTGQRAFTLTAAEQGNPANSVTAQSNVTALALSLSPRLAQPSSKVRFRGRGFTGTGGVYAHYLFRGKLRKTVRLAAKATGPCGTFSVRRRQIPVRDPKLGKWTLQVDQDKAYSATPTGINVLLAITVQRVFKSKR